MGRAHGHTASTDFGFARVFGTGRGADPDGAVSAQPVEEWSTFSNNYDDNGRQIPHTVSSISKLLAKFDPKTPLYMQDHARAHTLEGAQRIIECKRIKHTVSGKISFRPVIGEGTPVCADVGSFLEALAQEHPQSKVWFQPQRQYASAESLTSYMLFTDRRGRNLLSLITVY
jgi:hypothetical protein